MIDLPSPIKHDPRMLHYRVAEARLRVPMAERFGLAMDEPDVVREADGIMCATEARDLLDDSPQPWSKKRAMPLENVVRPWSSETARRVFLLRFAELMLRNPDASLGICPQCQGPQMFAGPLVLDWDNCCRACGGMYMSREVLEMYEHSAMMPGVQ